MLSLTTAPTATLMMIYRVQTAVQIIPASMISSDLKKVTIKEKNH